MVYANNWLIQISRYVPKGWFEKVVINMGDIAINPPPPSTKYLETRK